jgi:ATP-dependent DNA helicase RecQ
LPAAQQILKQYWGYHDFRPLQGEIIQSILNKRDTLALLPTGAGKSLCYQVPALMQEGFCLVVSPLIALMKDQVERLNEMDIRAECIHAGMHYMDVKRVLENMLHGPYKLLYVSPERLQTELFKEYLPSFNISFVAVDEAHCISQWGHDFRPDYLKIATLRKVFGVPVLALTATATPEVEKDIVKQLQLSSPAVFTQSFERSNIFYDVRYSENRNNDVLESLQQHDGCSIVYCRSRKSTEALAKFLIQHNIAATAYHAGMPKEKREEAQQAWMRNESRVMVATTAFGMGIDKADVRSVIHYDIPEHLEAYYQESGRAGRDGNTSVSLLLFNKMNVNNLKDSVELRFPKENYLRQVYQSVVEYLQVATGTQPDRYFDFDLAAFSKYFKLEATAASYALKLLEQEGLWTLSDAVFSPATIQFTCTREELDHVTSRYPEIATVVTSVLRLYGTVFLYPTAIRIGAIARQTRRRQEETDALLMQLHRNGILEYNKPKDGPQLFFHHYRVDSQHLIINVQRIATLRQQHQARVDAMIAYLEAATACRTRMMLAYFGEYSNRDCGHCDHCAVKQGRQQKVNIKELKARSLQLAAEPGADALQQISQQFPLAIRDDVAALIRELVDEGELKMNANGSVYIAK